MVRRLGFLLVAVGALVAIPAATAAYPAPFAVQGGAGLSSLDSSVRFVALDAGSSTKIAAVSGDGGATVMSRSVTGAYGIPTLTQSGLTGGLFHDGSAFNAEVI